MERVGFLGPEGTYSHAAALRYVSSASDNSIKLVPVPSLADLVDQIRELDKIILPIQNSSIGMVEQTFDALIRLRLGTEMIHLVHRLTLDIRHVLLIENSVELSKIKRIISHPAALAQCSRYIKQHETWQQESCQSTMDAVKKAQEYPDGCSAVVVPEGTDLPGWSKVADPSQLMDEPINQTEFWVLSLNNGDSLSGNEYLLWVLCEDVDTLMKQVVVGSGELVSIQTRHLKPSQLTQHLHLDTRSFQHVLMLRLKLGETDMANLIGHRLLTILISFSQ